MIRTMTSSRHPRWLLDSAKRQIEERIRECDYDFEFDLRFSSRTLSRHVPTCYLLDLTPLNASVHYRDQVSETMKRKQAKHTASWYETSDECFNWVKISLLHHRRFNRWLNRTGDLLRTLFAVETLNRFTLCFFILLRAIFVVGKLK